MQAYIYRSKYKYSNKCKDKDASLDKYQSFPINIVTAGLAAKLQNNVKNLRGNLIVRIYLSYVSKGDAQTHRNTSRSYFILEMLQDAIECQRAAAAILVHSLTTQ